MDVTKNKLEHLPEHLSRLTLLSDLHASENCIEALPDDIGMLYWSCQDDKVVLANQGAAM